MLSCVFFGMNMFDFFVSDLMLGGIKFYFLV